MFHNCHKWANSPKGSAFLYARREMQPLVEPLVVSWGWQSDKPGPSRFVDEQEWQGTRDIAAYLAVPAALKFMAEHDWVAVQRECHELARYARMRVSELVARSVPPITPDSSEWFAQMVALPIPVCDLDALKRRLYDEFRIEIPTVAWNGRHFIRLSVQGYNTRADVEALIEALRVLLP